MTAACSWYPGSTGWRSMRRSACHRNPRRRKPRTGEPNQAPRRADRPVIVLETAKGVSESRLPRRRRSRGADHRGVKRTSTRVRSTGQPGSGSRSATEERDMSCGIMGRHGQRDPIGVAEIRRSGDARSGGDGPKRLARAPTASLHPCGPP